MAGERPLTGNDTDARPLDPFENGLPPFADVIVALAGIASDHAADVRVSVPVEIEVDAAGGGGLSVRGSPPLFYTRTSVMTVHHQLRMRITSQAGG